MSLANVKFATKQAEQRAEALRLTAMDFHGVDPAGPTGWTVPELAAVAERKQKSVGYRTSTWRPGGEKDPGMPNYECLSCGFAVLEDEAAIKEHVKAHIKRGW